mmetsp:Transcript_21259/g.47985  ORF Transcript_21259/g.47985 Transcript_21259/m.47985 type:complete len:184 (-) Transcript_21259:227-778(-)|eukprot:CAMPEP_0172581852 /NCGR_PEP_ID=MMETSP1068-20121228/1223_1 /TAXON_ID=35684 /ORGANISM="Pseudopedinella elastica, Strain CCMP716" /LENGTH=183 /DNA_ID=CAMNT_0013374981 /DNA_START=95 /DNA_END=646 /DNA_ORIENTATION=+
MRVLYTVTALVLTSLASVSAWVPAPRVRALHKVSDSKVTLLAKKSDGGGGNKGGEGGGGGDQERSAKGAGTAVITIDQTDIETETETKTELDEEGWWRVLLHNDEIHTFEYVVEAIVKVVPQITRKKAFVISRTVHGQGTGTITTVWKSLAEQLCMGLQTFGLTVSIAPDSKFNDDNIRPPEE